MKRILTLIVLLPLLAACVPGAPVGTAVTQTATPLIETPTLQTTATPTFTPVVETPTPTTMPMCTPPPCAANELYYCPGDCPGGCGTICATMTPPSPTDFGPVPDDWGGLRMWLQDSYFPGSDTAVITTLLADAGWITSDDDMMVTDFTGDGRNEWTLLLYPPETRNEETRFPANLWVTNNDGVLYEHFTEPTQLGFSLQLQLLSPVNVTDNGLPELIINEESCGAHTCFTGIQVFTYRDGTFRNIVQPDNTEEPAVISVSYADIRFEDTTGDAILDVLVNGGAIGSVGAGIPRTYTEVWAWNPDYGALTLADTVLDPTEYRHHLIYEANDAYNSGGFATARPLFEQAINDDSLITPEFMTTPEETYAAIVQFATFRLMLIDLQESLNDTAANRLTTLQQSYPDAPLTEAAVTLLNNWSGTENLPALCGAITATLQTYENPTGGLAYLGYGNPEITAVHVCPHG